MVFVGAAADDDVEDDAAPSAVDDGAIEDGAVPSARCWFHWVGRPPLEVEFALLSFQLVEVVRGPRVDVEDASSFQPVEVRVWVLLLRVVPPPAFPAAKAEVCAPFRQPNLEL